MRYLYGIADEKFVKGVPKDKVEKLLALDSYKFRANEFLHRTPPWNKNDVPLVFKTSPETLLNLAAKVIDAMPLPKVYEWTNFQVELWIRNYGYPQYRNTFRENLINGRTLLLVNAQVLSAMNIRDFEHIKHIAYGIRQLFYYEMTKFGRSIMLPPEFHTELFKLLRVKSGGPSFLRITRSDLWRKMQLVRERSKYLVHWEILEHWLARQPDKIYPEVFGGIHRFRLYKCKKVPPPPPEEPAPPKKCTCMPPCECYWTERHLSLPTVLSCLRDRRHPVKDYNLKCVRNCMPPCTCGWLPQNYRTDTILTCLQHAFPHKYGALRHTRMAGSFLEELEAKRHSIWSM